MKQTISEIYNSLPLLEFRPAIADALHMLMYYGEKELHFGWNDLLKKEALKADSDKSILPKCDVLFTMISPNFRILGVQQRLAEKCSQMGLVTGIINVTGRNASGFDKVYRWYPQYPIDETVETEIMEQSARAYALLSNISPSKIVGNKGLIYLIKYANLVEAYAKSARMILEKVQAKLVFLNGSKFYINTAMEWACKEAGIKSVIVPASVLGRTQFPSRANTFLSWAPHYDSYLRELSIGESEVLPLGFLEPLFTLPGNIDELLKYKSRHTKTKHEVLLLSQYRGVKRTACSSLYTRLPEIIKLLKQMPEIKKVVLRLHPGEKPESQECQGLWKYCQDSKFQLSVNEPLIKNLVETNMIISLGSTALLYAPYLNIRGVEVRDHDINQVFGATVLPLACSYQIGDSYKASELADFIRDSEIIHGEEVLYNWRKELELFPAILEKLMNYS